MMKRSLFGIILLLYSVSSYAENVQAIFDEGLIDVTNNGYLLVVIVENDERKDNLAYLSYQGSKQLVIFTTTSLIYQRVAGALSTLPSGKA